MNMVIHKIHTRVKWSDWIRLFPDNTSVGIYRQIIIINYESWIMTI
jgi:hypothetical protein